MIPALNFLQTAHIRPTAHLWGEDLNYHQTSNKSRNLVGNKIVDHTDVVGISPVSAAPITSWLNTWLKWIRQRQEQDEEKHLSFGI